MNSPWIENTLAHRMLEAGRRIVARRHRDCEETLAEARRQLAAALDREDDLRRDAKAVTVEHHKELACVWKRVREQESELAAVRQRLWFAEHEARGRTGPWRPEPEPNEDVVRRLNARLDDLREHEARRQAELAGECYPCDDTDLADP